MAIVGESTLFAFSVVDGAALLFLTVYFVITLSDLECDYINAMTCCSRLNKWVLPEIIAHGLLPVLMFFSFHLVLFALNIPLSVWQIYRFVTKPSGDIGIYDPTEIHNRQKLKGFMKEAMGKLGFHLIMFFIYLYCLIVSLITGLSASENPPV